MSITESSSLESQETIENIAQIQRILDLMIEQTNLPGSTALKALNPFGTIEELTEFSNRVNHGVGITFERLSHGMGETIQGKYILNFLKQYFPMATFAEVKVNSSTDTVIPIIMRDFLERQNNSIKFQNSFSQLPIQLVPIEFSMVETKIIHNSLPDIELTDKLKQLIFAEFRKQMPHEYRELLKNDSVPIVVGNVNPNELLQLQGSYWVITLGSGIRLDFVDGQDKVPMKMAHIPFDKRGMLRFLYLLGDYAAITSNRNKMEGLVSGAKVISVTDEYLDKSYNPNYFLDVILREKGLSSIPEIQIEGELKKTTERAHLSESEIEEIHERYLESRRNTDEPTLKESMRRIFDEIENTSKS